MDTLKIEAGVGVKVNYDGVDTVITEGVRNILGIPCVKLQGVSHHVTVDELVRQFLNPVQPKPTPEYNPQQVVILDGPHCKIHGWTAGETYPTSPLHSKIDGPRDANGLNIYVHSILRDYPVYLGTKEYQP